MGLTFDVWPPGAEAHAILIATTAFESSGGDLAAARRQLQALIPALVLPDANEEDVAFLTEQTLAHPDLVALASNLRASRSDPSPPEGRAAPADVSYLARLFAAYRDSFEGGDAAATEGRAAPADASYLARLFAAYRDSLDGGDAAATATAKQDARPDPPTPTETRQPARSLDAPIGRLVCISSSSNGTLRVWDVLNPASTGRPGPPVWGNVNSVALTTGPDGRLLAALALRRRSSGITIWDTHDATPVTSFFEGPARGRPVSVALGLASDGQVLCVSGYGDGSLLVRDASTGDPVAVLVEGHHRRHPIHKNYPIAMATAPDGRLVCVSSASEPIGALQVWDVARGQQIGSPLAGHDIVRTFALGKAPDGRLIAVAVGWEGTQSTVRVWEVLTGVQLRGSVGGPRAAIRSVALGTTHDGRLVEISVGATGSVRARDVLSDRPIHAQLDRHLQLDRHRARTTARPAKKGARSVALASAPDGGLIAATGTREGTVQFWDVDANAYSPLGPPLAGHTDVVNALVMAVGA